VANDLYPAARSMILAGGLDWTTDPVTIALLDDTYTYSEAHVTGAHLTGVLAIDTLTNKAILAGGVADASDLSVAGVDLGEEVNAVVLLKGTGTTAGDALIYFADENSDTTPISRVSDGTPIPVLWDDGPDRIFRL
jgi:hypothetical protein